MSFTLSTSAAIIYKAGKDNPMYGHADSAALIAKFSDEAEGVVCAMTHTDWVTDYSSVGTNFKPILDEAVSCYAGMLVINYDPTSYPLRSTAEGMKNLLNNNFERCIRTLTESNNRKAMGLDT